MQAAKKACGWCTERTGEKPSCQSIFVSCFKITSLLHIKPSVQCHHSDDAHQPPKSALQLSLGVPPLRRCCSWKHPSLRAQRGNLPWQTSLSINTSAHDLCRGPVFLGRTLQHAICSMGSSAEAAESAKGEKYIWYPNLCFGDYLPFINKGFELIRWNNCVFLKSRTLHAWCFPIVSMSLWKAQSFTGIVKWGGWGDWCGPVSATHGQPLPSRVSSDRAGSQGWVTCVLQPRWVSHQILHS